MNLRVSKLVNSCSNNSTPQYSTLQTTSTFADIIFSKPHNIPVGKKSKYHPISSVKETDSQRSVVPQDHRARKWQIGVYTDISFLGLYSLLLDEV